MIGKIAVITVLLLLPFFSLTKSASYADRKMEEFHDALISKEKRINERTSQIS
ncbi:MAG: hypothetical protein PHD56_06665 [Anaerostipes sp.]|jgi:hypothetical protein|uniref:hypothetical protein n=1 Tax=Enterocloster bolteae TaxID=208479 RepID=UPI002109C8D9|nr:hypothetical protein [Enterocloster bolteae]MCQ4756915.1 hypothetical protein [Enterocloster bolteae]MDD4370736.1 hypothetical protein [Anaerostipes sp.]